MALYPTDVKVFIDDKDVTKFIWGSETITLSEVNNTWRNIDISQFIRGPGLHKIEITAGTGVGRVEARVEMK